MRLLKKNIETASIPSTHIQSYCIPVTFSKIIFRHRRWGDWQYERTLCWVGRLPNIEVVPRAAYFIEKTTWLAMIPLYVNYVNYFHCSFSTPLLFSLSFTLFSSKTCYSNKVRWHSDNLGAPHEPMPPNLRSLNPSPTFPICPDIQVIHPSVLPSQNTLAWGVIWNVGKVILYCLQGGNTGVNV